MADSFHEWLNVYSFLLCMSLLDVVKLVRDSSSVWYLVLTKFVFACLFFFVFKSVTKRLSCIWLAVPISTKQMLFVFIESRFSCRRRYHWSTRDCLQIISGVLISYLNGFLPLLTGLSDIPGEAMVKLYCPKCMDVYTPKSSRHHHTDGAYFGTGFPHMLFMVHPEYRPKRPANQFVPRLALIFSCKDSEH